MRYSKAQSQSTADSVRLKGPIIWHTLSAGVNEPPSYDDFKKRAKKGKF